MKKGRMQQSSILQFVRKPSRYAGGELYSVNKSALRQKNPADILHTVFCFPDLYEIGMSNLALQILYNILNQDAHMWCERAFMPDSDMREIMLQRGIQLESLESGTPLAETDALLFSVHYEMAYVAILDMLFLSGLELYAKDRAADAPLVVAGGPVACNMEPIAPFMDVILYGEGEEMLPEVLELYRKAKLQHLSKHDFLREAAKLEGVYVPLFYEAEYDASGDFTCLRPLDEAAPPIIRRRFIHNLNTALIPQKPIVPNMAVIHDRVVVEAFRGCARGCRFCQAGIIYRPVRERSAETLAEAAQALIANTGEEELGILSLSTSDYSALHDFVSAMLPDLKKRHVNLSLPSLRLDSFDLTLLEDISNVRKAGLTFAPEAGTQRLRDVINKNITENDLFTACETAFRGGYDRLKLYFMLGLPTETDEDVIGIATLAHKVLDIWYGLPRQERGKRPKITVSASFFIPKPWTPFQWEPQISKSEMQRRAMLLSQHLKSHNIACQWHDYDTSVVEAALARGDRRVAAAIYEAHRQGSFLDAWDEHFSFERWLQAFSLIGGMERYIKGFSPEKNLPWQHMSPHVSEAFLRSELNKAKRAEVTAPCLAKCSGCGLAGYRCGICQKWHNK